MSRYYCWDNIISKSECKLIIDDCKKGVEEIGEIGGGDVNGITSNDYMRLLIYISILLGTLYGLYVWLPVVAPIAP
jgi:hypothetical protein